MNSIQIGILGLGRLGTSIGLALKRYNARKDSRHQFDVTAHDPRASMTTAAEKRGAAARYARGVMEAVSGKDIVIVALPYADMEAAYRTIAPALRADAVVLDTAPLKLPSLDWARKHFPATVHMIGVMPIVNPKYLYTGLDESDDAAEDLFDQGALLLMPDVRANSDALQLASDFALVLGATPHFVDPVEYDGLAAATEGLPALLGVAMFRMLARSQGWNDAQRAGNPALGQLTHHLRDTHPDDLRDLLLFNRENTARYLSDLIDVLDGMRDTLLRNDRDALEATLIEAADTYQAWLRKRSSGRWEDKGEGSGTSAGESLMSGLLGGYLARRLRGDKKDN
jgi:prephenate dehydrogenase